MDLFTQLFGGMLAFVYHCFDRIVIYGYLSGLSRPERVLNFFRQVVGVPVVSKEILSRRTAENGSAVRSPTADSTIGPLPVTSRPASWKPHTTVPTKPSSRSSICSPHDGRIANVIVGVFSSEESPR